MQLNNIEVIEKLEGNLKMEFCIGDDHSYVIVYPISEDFPFHLKNKLFLELYDNIVIANGEEVQTGKINKIDTPNETFYFGYNGDNFIVDKNSDFTGIGIVTKGK